MRRSKAAKIPSRGIPKLEELTDWFGLVSTMNNKEKNNSVSKTAGKRQKEINLIK